MLNTDEVDVDYFTPTESSSLASIFGKGSQADESKENPSLKYVPPPPPSTNPEVNPTPWIFSCAIHGFEWSSSGYISRGRLGIAVLKVKKHNSHSIILYDSNKTTVSFATISSKFKVYKREVSTISYYDNTQKYWSINISEDICMNKLLQVLQNLQVTIIDKSFQETDREQSDNNKTDNKLDIADTGEGYKDEKEMDTDSYMNQKTKDSIIKRMANMGHSVLPSHGISKGQASESSDSDDIDGNTNNIRHKPVKGVPKRSVDLNTQENEGIIASHQKKVVHKSHIDGQSQVSTKSNISICGADMNNFVSEQRVNNTEIRMNVSRISDKLDLVLEKLNFVTNTDKCNTVSNFQNDIVQKLLKEYECKIQSYETSKCINNVSTKPSVDTLIETNINEKFSDIETYKNQLEELKNACLEKDMIIISMKNEIKELNDNNTKLLEENNKITEDSLKEMNIIKESLEDKNEDIANMKKKIESDNTSNQDTSDVTNRVKKIMNDTFQAISGNFNDEENYTGATLKTIIATVIKKTTIEALKEV